VAMDALKSDERVAENMAKMQEPVSKK